MDAAAIESLSKLFDVGEKAVEKDVQVSGASRGLNPGGIGGIIPGVKVKAPRRDPKAIWDDDEVPEVVVDEVDDGRERPAHEFYVKQAVGTQDVFLGLSLKDPSSMSCETLVVEVSLPGTASAQEIDLDVQENYLRVATARYKLGTFLPQRVRKDKGKAEWIKDKGVLKLELPFISDMLEMMGGGS